MPKVLQVIQQAQFRGAEVFALDLSRELIRQGAWQASLLSLFATDNGYVAAAEASGVPVRAMGGNASSRRLDVRLAARLGSAIEEGDYRIVQANGGSTLKYLVTARALSRGSWTLVYRAIGVGSYWRRGTFKRYFYRWLLNQARMVAAVSRAVAEDLIAFDRIDARKVTVIPSGVDPVRAAARLEDRAVVRGALGVLPSETLLMYVGSLAPEKNLGALVDALAACRQQGLPVKALVLGAGPSRDELLAGIRRQHLDGAIVVQSSPERVGRFLAGADLFVLPSLSEGMPMVLIEAGLAGVPAVAYAVGGVPEVIRHNVTGLLVPVNDRDGLTRAVADLVQDDRRRRAMSAAAQEEARRFEIASVAGRFSRLYAGLLNGQRGLPASL